MKFRRTMILSMGLMLAVSFFSIGAAAEAEEKSADMSAFENEAAIIESTAVKKIDVKITGKKSVTFGEKYSHRADFADPAQRPDGDEVSFKLLYNGSDIAPKDAGKYEITAVSENPNYEVAGYTLQSVREFTILKKPLEILDKEIAVSFDDTSLKEITAESLGIKKDGSFVIEKTEDTILKDGISQEGKSLKFSLREGIKAGEAKDNKAVYNLKFIPDDGNFSEASFKITISLRDKKSAELTLTASDIKPVYGKNVEFTAEVKNSANEALEGTVRFYFDGQGEAFREASLEGGRASVTLDRAALTVGKHILRSEFAGGEDYISHDAAVSLEVSKREAGFDTSSLKPERKRMGKKGEVQVTGSLKLSGVMDGDDVDITPSLGLFTDGFSDKVKPGEYEVRVKGLKAFELVGEDRENYILKENFPKVTATVNNVITVEENGFKIEAEEGISSVPEKFIPIGELNTSEKIYEAMVEAMVSRGIEEGNIKVWDVECFLKEAGNWIKIGEDFFEGGKTVTVKLPYPKGISCKDFDFAASHLFTAGDRAGTFEVPLLKTEADGIYMRLSGLSPVAVGWGEKIREASLGGHYSYINAENSFWENVAYAVISADEGAVLVTDTFGYDRMSWIVMDALMKRRDVTLLLEDKDMGEIEVSGELVTLIEENRIYYPIKYLSLLNIEKEEESLPEHYNPPTGAEA